jgi:hypothetical protein
MLLIPDQEFTTESTEDTEEADLQFAIGHFQNDQFQMTNLQ